MSPAVLCVLLIAATLGLRALRPRPRHSLTYRLYLRSPLWRARRRIWILQAGGRCQCCRSRRRLSVHHRTYKRLGLDFLPTGDSSCCHGGFLFRGVLPTDPRGRGSDAPSTGVLALRQPGGEDVDRGVHVPVEDQAAVLTVVGPLSKGQLGFAVPHAEQVFEDGYHRSILRSSRP